MLLLFILLNFGVSFLSDLVLNFLSRQSYSYNAIKSLQTYFDKRPTLISAFYAGITVCLVLIENIILSRVLFGMYYPSTLYQLFAFLSIAFPLGYISDVIIYKAQIFGDTLNPYYELVGSGLWGAIAYIFSIVVSYGILHIDMYNLI